MVFLIRKREKRPWRFFGSYPEGVSFSILLMNILTPYIDMITKTKPLGAITKKKEAKSE